ncbi:hypothetical protein [Citricoccus nitrophenolicus]|uniref:hypothetical protein n=1 Tax=Citricoccus nitrophenolicus TaxID=863575 RepID=UPI0039B6E7EB
MTDHHPEQPGNEPNDRPQYGIRLTPEQQAEHQARLEEARRARETQQGQQGQSPYGQPPQGQPQPGQQPYGHPSQGAQQPFGPIEKPQTIDRSYWLIIAAGVAFLITELISLLSPNLGLTPEMMDAYREQMDAAGVSGVDLESMLPAVRVVSVVFTAILAGLYWLIATGIRRGSNLARIFGTILAVLSLLAAFGPGFVYVALGVAGLVFAYLKPSSEYLRAKAWEKAMRR